MALVQKGSRNLVVDGMAYRWTVRHRPTYCQEMGWSPLSFAVEAANDGSCILHVVTQARRADSVASLYGHDRSASADASMAVTPALVAHSIRLALQQGWQPHRPGSAFELSLPQLTTHSSELPLSGN
ncbi:MAG: hypothetical protein LBJ15_03975 [Comamonas sp.]|jgi:hypothetical protein|uniref:hypothetical protein n=1 Tax=Comamonas sp. TaxID=34028 RepID=UPI0028282C02|nr:hypothetical protein [Comamonas sp.]MDR0213146.1 hypothetical protein [Comamonas sp.]